MSTDIINREDIVPPPKDEEELELEKLVFGDLKGFETSLKNIDLVYDDSEEYDSGSDDDSHSSDEDEDEIEQVQDDQLFFVDEGENEQDGEQMDIDEDEDEDDEDVSDSSDAWYDSEDDKVNISLLQSDKLKKLRTKETDDSIKGKVYINRLRSQFERIYPRPKWVDDESSEDDDDSSNESLGSDDDENERIESGDIRALSKILKSAKSLTNTKQSKLLPPTKLDIIRLKDSNHKNPSKSAIQASSFHPTHPLFLTSGYDRTIRIYQIDGKNNNLVSSIHLRDTPIQSAAFSPDPKSNKVFAGGRRRYMYSWDLQTGAVEKISRLYGHEETQRSFENFKVSPKGSFIGLIGNNGWINILSSHTSQWINGFKIEGTIVDFDWSEDEEFIIAVNSIGDVWEFSLETKKVLRRWKDETGVGITKVKIGGKNNRWCAIGSTSGVVNVYDRLSNNKLIGTSDHLVTSISTLEFNPDGQILCVASRAKKDSLRLLHLPTCKVFQNWPTSGTPFGKVTSVAFSPNSEMISVSNEAGKARLWRLNHY